MVNKMKRFIAAFMTILIVINMSGLGTSIVNADDVKEDTVEIEVIFNRNESQMQPYIAAFEKKYPSIKVKYTCYNDLETSLKQRINSGEYGDVMYFPSYITTEEAHNYFEPLGEYNALSEKYNYLNQGRYYNNVVYGIPSSAYLIGVVYNKEVFDKAGITTIPTTIDEFMHAMYLINEHTDAIPFYAGLSEPWILNNWEAFPFVEMTGKSSYKFSGFVTDVNPFRQQTVHNKTLKLLYDMVESGYTEVGVAGKDAAAAVNKGFGWWDSIIKMNNGEIGCSVIGTWALSDYKNVGSNGHNIGFMPFPNNIDGRQYVTVAGDYSYAVAKNSKNKEAAKLFVSFMLDESGYAFDHDTISVLKQDPYPECYGDMTNVTVLNSYSTTAEGYELYNRLSSKLNLYNQEEYVRLVEAAAGIRNESFDDVMNDWNTRWEASRNESDISIIPDTDNSQQESNIIDYGNTKIEFSDNEKNYIENKGGITAGYHTSLAPFSFEQDGEFLGIASDICNMISQKSGLEINYRGYNTTAELIEALNNGEIDFIAGIEKQQTVTGIRYSKEYIEYMDVLIRHNTMEASMLQKFCGVSGEKYSSFEQAVEVMYGENVDDCIDNVEHRRADFSIINYYSANYYIRSNRYDDITVIPYANNQTYHAGFAENTDPILVAIVNKCIYSLSDGEVELMLMEYMDEVVMNINLETFIRSNPVLSISCVVLIFALMFLILFEVYHSKSRELIDARKYTMLAMMADESFFEYNYRKGIIKFDNKFVKTEGVERETQISNYSGNNQNFNQMWEQIKDTVNFKKEKEFTVSLTDDEGNKRWYRIITSLVFDQKQQPVDMLGKIINIQREMEELASYQDKAYRDSLTKLYNREGLTTNANAMSSDSDVVCAVMDMDNFKLVNDTLGHDGGDYALMFFADKLREHMGDEALLARFGGDEFVVMLSDTKPEKAEDKLKALVNAMNVTLRYSGKHCEISISAGAICLDKMSTFEEMFQNADKVLYEAKAKGKNNYIIR